ncbi:phosphatase PAP2 family protein [Leptotrichia sp. oral taxon 879]|uniref:phosphatase PAP2 family protein n=1 Tax=Leptotrichia sp. oral taxon 879 TaxID=1227267 RepID=UPI0003AD9AE4|nr:phosphatase PAP2 family protein [Leptotrichia sp. oral taxon 879]ERK50501.1 PAP2 family protein [Leptotrichia sp. oral taxon 879 str. F0557]
MPLQLTNNIFFIDRFFFKHLSFFSKSSIFYNSKNIEKFFRIITKFGEGYFELSLILILFFIIFLNKKKFHIFKKYIAGIFFTLLSTQITVNLFKLLFGRARPSVTTNPEKFYGVLSLIKNNFLFEGDYASFPSGHTITVWGTIWILSFFIKNRYIKMMLFVLGFLVGVSRVYLRYHWTTDVIASIIISYFIAKFVYNRMHGISFVKDSVYGKKVKKIGRIKRKREKLGVVN